MMSVFENVLSPNSPPPSIRPKTSLVNSMYSKEQQQHQLIAKRSVKPRIVVKEAEEGGKNAKIIVIKGSDKLFLKEPKDETLSQKQYTQLVHQYHTAKEKSVNRPPTVNYTQLLSSIKGKIDELNDPKLRTEIIKKRQKGDSNKYLWNTEEIIKEVDLLYSTRNKDEGEAINKGFDEMNAGEIRKTLMQKEKRALVVHSARNSERMTVRTVNEGEAVNEKRANSLLHKRVIIGFKNKVNNCLETIKNDYKVSVKEWVGGNLLSMNSFVQEYSKKFFCALKAQDNQTVVQLLNLNPRLAFDVNPVYFFSFILINRSHKPDSISSQKPIIAKLCYDNSSQPTRASTPRISSEELHYTWLLLRITEILLLYDE